MRTSRNATEFASDSLQTRCDAQLLGRLGRELAAVYQDTLRAPLPPRLLRLMESLDPSHDGMTEGSPPVDRTA